MEILRLHGASLDLYTRGTENGKMGKGREEDGDGYQQSERMGPAARSHGGVKVELTCPSDSPDTPWTLPCTRRCSRRSP